MERKKLIMLGLACLGVVGTTAVVLSGQNVITAPSVLAGDLNKSKTFDKDTVVSAYDSGGMYNYSVAATENHSLIGLYLEASDASSSAFGSDGSFFKSTYTAENSEIYFAIGLNNITDFSVTYTCGLTTDKTQFLLMDAEFGPASGEDADQITGVTEYTFHYASEKGSEYAGGNAVLLMICFIHMADGQGASSFNITSMTVEWDC